MFSYSLIHGVLCSLIIHGVLYSVSCVLLFSHHNTSHLTSGSIIGQAFKILVLEKSTQKNNLKVPACQAHRQDFSSKKPFLTSHDKYLISIETIQCGMPDVKPSWSCAQIYNIS